MVIQPTSINNFSFIKENGMNHQTSFYVIAEFFNPAASIVLLGSERAFGGKPETS